ncbi:MAG: lysostaphin resistance A-like protein, partial [Candidatus Methanofastidiosia archaeon]
NGNLIRRYKSESISDLYFKDFDGDGDLDLLTIKWDEDDASKVRLFNNTMKVGFLDSMESFGKLEKVSLKEEGFEKIYERDYEAMIAETKKIWEEYTKTPFSLKSEWEKFKFFSRFPSLFFIAYKTEIKIFLGIVCFLGFLLATFLTKFLKKKESNWQPLWSFKKVILYFTALITFYPIALIYLLYKILKSSEDYKKALGLIRITKRQIFISVGIGLILFLTSWSLTILFALSDLKLPDTSGTENLIKNYLLFAILLFVISAPIGEEIIYSGYLYPILRGRFGIKFGIFSIALLFSVMHLKPVLIPILFVGALVKTYAYEKTHCIYVPMIIHFINNSIVITLISLI